MSGVYAKLLTHETMYDSGMSYPLKLPMRVSKRLHHLYENGLESVSK